MGNYDVMATWRSCMFYVIGGTLVAALITGEWCTLLGVLLPGIFFTYVFANELGKE